MNNAEHYASLGLDCYIKKNYSESKKNFKKAIEIDSTNATYFNNLGLAHFLKKEYVDAENNFREAIKLDSTNAHYFNNLGLVMNYSKKSKLDAINSFKRATELDPETSIYFNNLAASYSFQQNHVKAEENFKKATELDSKDTGYLNRLAMSQYQQEKYLEAEKTWKKAIELNPGQSEYYFNSGLMCYTQKKYSEAENFFKKATEIEPQNVIYFSNLGLSYYEQGKFLEAEKNFEIAIKLDATQHDYFYRLGLIQYKLKKYSDAINSFKKATKLEPQNTTYFSNLALSYYEQSNYSEAIIHYNKAISITPEDPILYNRLGMSYYDNKDYKNAVIAFEKALELRPNNCIYIGNLGLAAAELRDYKKAEINMKKALNFNENNVFIIDKLLAVFEMQNKNKSYLKLFLEHIKLIDKPFEDIIQKINLLNITQLEDVTSVMGKENENVLKIIENSHDFQLDTRRSCLISIIKLMIYVRKFKKDLLVKDKKLTTLFQYTSINTLASLLNVNNNDNENVLKNNVNIRLYNTDYMNDPEEGKFLNKVLNKFIETNNYQPLKSSYNVSHAFIASLTSKDKKDEIPMWSTYGRNSQGVSIGFRNLPYYDDKPSEKSFHSLVRSDEDMLQKNSYDYIEENVQLYKVMYLNLNMAKNIEKTIDNENLKNIFITIKEISKLENQMLEEKQNDLVNEVYKEISPKVEKETMKKIYNVISEEMIQDVNKKINSKLSDSISEKLNNSESKDFLKKLPILSQFGNFISVELDRIRFLVKNSNYQYEDEYRLLKMVKDCKSSGSSIKYDVGNPKLYLEYSDIKIDEIIFGVDSEGCTKWRPIIELKSPNTDINKVTNSTIKISYT